MIRRSVISWNVSVCWVWFYFRSVYSSYKLHIHGLFSLKDGLLRWFLWWFFPSCFLLQGFCFVADPGVSLLVQTVNPSDTNNWYRNINAELTWPDGRFLVWRHAVSVSAPFYKSFVPNHFHLFHHTLCHKCCCPCKWHQCAIVAKGGRKSSLCLTLKALKHLNVLWILEN